ncbi:hypothetical protein KIN20_010622 [Parelaphostrongylus tenuis]|uniref:Uncharacterized protein n=1 Tax=Parelaphostrongylus tenuis TaxID=148309 RepID=A0AAD5MBS9_PARTN|nr:hypothetical protein KIN20_010622 [Parelaphostrongylus tenuis]
MARAYDLRHLVDQVGRPATLVVKIIYTKFGCVVDGDRSERRYTSISTTRYIVEL